MKYNFIIAITLFSTSILCQGQLDMNPYIDAQQTRIDSLDKIINGTIALDDDAEQREMYNKVYFKMVDKFQNRVNNSLKLYQWQRKNLLFGMSQTLAEVNERTYKLPLYYEKLFQNALGIVSAVENDDIMSFLITDPLYSIKNIYFYEFTDVAKPFLIQSANTYPNEVLKSFYKYQERPYSDTVVEICGIVAPNVTKNYLIGETEIKNILTKNTNPSIMGMRGFFAKYNILSKGMVLVDDIIEGKITINEAHTISLDDRQFLRKMIEIRNSDYIQATYSIDEQLHNTCLEYVRKINELHNESNPKIRFASIDDFNWKELYTLLVYSEEEIFTSSFNGVFERLIFRLNEDKVPGDKMLETLKYNRFRTFIKICANYGKVETFLNTMPAFKSREILARFTNNLDKNEGDLRSAINVANAYSSITDTSLLNFMRYNIDNEYMRVLSEKSKGGIAIYGLLSSLFLAPNDNKTDWNSLVAARYQLQPIGLLYNDQLFGHDGVHRQIHFFYDDEDGDASFSSFMSTFNNGNYKTTNFTNYVIIESTRGKKVKIYANKPKSELEGQGDLIELIKTFGNDIQMMVHRGHSYYAMNTIDQIPSTTKIVFLGSCGSYHNIHEVLGRSQNVHIISSKQIGSMSVNNPLLLEIAETVRNDKNLVWSDVWSKTSDKIGKYGYAAERFRDYVSPDKNLGAIFLQAYTKMVTQEK